MIDPTDDGGQFQDRGSQYRTAIFYTNEDQKKSLKLILLHSKALLTTIKQSPLKFFQLLNFMKLKHTIKISIKKTLNVLNNKKENVKLTRNLIKLSKHKHTIADLNKGFLYRTYHILVLNYRNTDKVLMTLSAFLFFYYNYFFRRITLVTLMRLSQTLWPR